MSNLRHSSIALAALLLTTATISANDLQNDLQLRVEHAIRTAQIGAASVGVSISDCETGLPLVEINADDAKIPASNMKVITTGAALHVLGADFHFETNLLYNAAANTLIVKGDGDPAFGDPELLAITHFDGKEGLSINEMLDIWVSPVAQYLNTLYEDAEIKPIDALIVDDRIFDRQFVHDSWPREQLNARSYAEVSGLNFHLNQLFLYLSPRPNRPPVLTAMAPDYDWLPIGNKATSHTGAGKRNTAWVGRAFETNDMAIYGNVKFAYEQTHVPVTIHNAPELFGRLLANRLANAGVDVETTRVAADTDGEFESRPPTKVIAPVIRTPISTVLTRCNRDSQNLYAESLVKRMGAAVGSGNGSWNAGTSIMRHVLLDRLKDPSAVSNFVAADGSGLSRKNRITPRAMTQWLDSFAQDEELGDTFIQSLAVGGESGTLEKRFNSTELHGAVVHAKSGYVNQVSCLSGYVTGPDGERTSFSVLVNDLKIAGTVRKAKRLQEKIVSLIAEEMAKNSSAPEEVTLGSD